MLCGLGFDSRYTWEDCMDTEKIILKLTVELDLIDSIVEVFHTLRYFLLCWESSIYIQIWPWKYLFLLSVLPDFPLFWRCCVHEVEEFCLYELLLYEKTLILDYSLLIHFSYYYSDSFILISLEWAITLILLLFTYLGINIWSAFLLRSINWNLICI